MLEALVRRRKELAQKPSETRVEKTTTSRIRFEAEGRSQKVGGGRLKEPWPSRLQPHCSQEGWEEFKKTINQELRAEMQLRKTTYGAFGIPTLVVCESLALAILVAAVVGVLDLVEKIGMATVIIPCCLIIGICAFLQVMLWKYSAKMDRRIAAVHTRLEKACEKFSNANRTLFVTMHMGPEICDALDAKKHYRHVKLVNDVFYLDVLVVPSLAKPSAEKVEECEAGGSTRTPSARSSASSSLRNAAQADDKLEPEMESEEVRPSSNSSDKKAPPGARCPAGHLLGVADGHDWNCDSCDRGFRRGELVYMCELCDFGLCKRCVNGNTKARVQQKKQEGEPSHLDPTQPGSHISGRKSPESAGVQGRTHARAPQKKGEPSDLSPDRPGSHGSGSKSLASGGSKLAWT